MQKEDIVVLAQLVTALKDAAHKLEVAYQKKDAELLGIAKKEVLSLQDQIAKLL